MSIFEDAQQSLTPDETQTDDDPDPSRRTHSPGRTARFSDTFTTQVRGNTVTVDGDQLTIERPETKQTDDSSGNWITGSQDKYGRPRGVSAMRQRKIVQTSAMQSIVNGIVDQLLGGELAFEENEDVMEDLSDAEVSAAGDLKAVVRDVLTGPHLNDEDLDDIVTACVEDMLGPGNAYIQLLGPESGGVPVVALSTLDPLTIRHNVDKHGYPKNPPYWQATGAFSGSQIAQIGSLDPVPLQYDDVAVLHYPKGNRSYRHYPVSAAWQVKEWLEILVDSTVHHKRYYSDNEVPPGLLQVVEASDNTVQDIQAKVEEASGDPRDFPIVGGEAPANWIEMGGTAINLDVISEQQWFYQLCLGSLGLGKAEVGWIEDVNYSNGEIESQRIYKRVAGPFGKQFKRAFVHIASQFDLYNELGQPFSPRLSHTDPRQEAARQERLRKDYESGKITLRQFVRRAGDEGLADDEDMYTVDVDGETIDYGAHPKWVAERLLSSAGVEDGEPQSESETDDDGDE